MPEWFSDEFHRRIVESGRLPLFFFFAAMVLTFLFIRLSVRLIRAGVRWWPGNVKPGGLHIHHVVFGVVLMVISGVAGITVPSDEEIWTAIFAAAFGVGTALVLDEFALLLHLSDVYWSEKGRLSVDTIFVAIAVTGLLLLGSRPFGVDTLSGENEEDDGALVVAIVATVIALNFAVVLISLLKGKIWTGFIGTFVLLLAVVGAIRIARPGSLWARWRYKDRPQKMRKARWREQRIRQPLMRAKVWVQEVISGRHE